jgi:thioredoxin-related protein
MKQAILFFAFTLALFNITNAQTPSADKVLYAAYQQAMKESKNVMIIFHASWCGWCKKMDASINDASCKKLFDDNYVIVHLTVDESEQNKSLENPGAADYRTKYHGDKAGLPFFVIVDNQGEMIGDSYIRNHGEKLDQPGENIGCPAKAEEVDAFIKTLKSTSKLTDAQLKVIAKRFRKNEQ